MEIVFKGCVPNFLWNGIAFIVARNLMIEWDLSEVRMAREIATTEEQAELLKDQGNIFFKKDRLAAAIEAYTEVPLRCSHSRILLPCQDGRDYYPIRVTY